MEYVLDHPWDLAFLLGIALAFVLDLGRRAAVRYQIEQAAKNCCNQTFTLKTPCGGVNE